MRMMALVEDGTAAVSTTNATNAFIIRDFEELTPLLITHPDMIVKELPQLDVLESLVNDTEALVVKHSASQEESLRVRKKKTREMESLLVRLTRHGCQQFVHNLVERWSTETPQHLEVSVTPRRNLLKHMLSGRLRADAEVRFKQLVFAPIRVSSGVIEAKRMMLNWLSFMPNPLRKGLRRYPSKFAFHFKDCTFTQNDLFGSNCIRNGLQNLLIRILGRIDQAPKEVVIDSIRILGSGKVVISGMAYGDNVPFEVPFEVRSRISISGRGHVLTFPELEASVNHSLLPIFVPVPGVHLDIGHNAHLEDVTIDGSRRQLSFSGSATITPEPVTLPDHIQPTDSYMARHAFDVGKWLTDLGRFSV